MLYLRTFGSVYLTRDGGPPLGGAAGQRRLLGLLAILSVAGDGGMSRDRIISLLWPDTDDERGRHSLTQATYHARRALGCDDLFVPGTDVRLDPTHITSDVREFEAAFATGNADQVASLYTGPFLEDFHIAGNVELDRWAEARRRQLQDRIHRSLDGLARQSLSSGDLSAAIAWRGRAAALDPLDSNAARLLIEAMANAGDQTGALRHAHVHETLIRSELEVELDPTFSAFVERLRATQRAVHVTASRVPTLETTGSGIANQLGVARPSTTTEVAPSGQPTTGTTRRRIRWSARRLATLSGMVVVLALVTEMTMRTRSKASIGVPSFDQSIVVAPFRVTGADPSLGFLREGLVELLSIRLSGDSSARTVDAGAMLRAWRHTSVLDSTDIQRSEVVQFAKRFGAVGVVVGSVVGDARHLVITASLLAVGDSALEVTASAAGPADSLTALVDRVAGRLLAERTGEGERFANRVTPSLPALRAYLVGRAEYREGHFASAMREYEHALRADSTFALAALQLALSADRMNVAEQHDRALSLAWTNRDDLSERDRLHLIAFAGPRYPEPSTEAEQLAAWEAAVAASPDRVEVLTELAERITRAGRVLGVANPERRATAILRRVLDLDPGETAARRQLVMLAARSGDVEQLRLVGRAEAKDGSAKRMPTFVRWRVALATRDSQALDRIRLAMPRVDDISLRAIGMAAQFDAVGSDDAERSLRIRALRARRSSEQLDAILAQHSLALNQGRPFVALDLTEQLEETQPGSRAHLRLRVLDALYGSGDRGAADDAAVSLSRFVDAPRLSLSSALAVQLADACVLAQWRIATGALETIRRTIGELRAAGVPRTAVPIGANPHMCADILDASLAVATKARGALARVARLDSLVLGGPAAGDAGAYAHIVVARLYEQMGKPRLALDAIRRRPYMDGWPRYLATARREEGRLALLAGERAAGFAAYRAYLALRNAPEASTAGEVADVRSAVDAEGDRPR